MNNPATSLVINENYIFIDYLYINEFKKLNIYVDHNILELRKTLFPYCENPFSLIKAKYDKMYFSNITVLKPENINPSNIHQFCSDSGIILVVPEYTFFTFISLFDSNRFIDHIEAEDDTSRWFNYNIDSTNDAKYFFTSEIDKEFSGGGNFQVERVD